MLFVVLMIQTSQIFSQTVTNNDSTKIIALPKWVLLNIISELKTTDLVIEQNHLISEQNDLQKKQIEQLTNLNNNFKSSLVECRMNLDNSEYENLKNKKQIEFLTKQSRRRKRNLIFTVGFASILLILK
jgi:ribosomal protein L29